jgi:hypothetical protein
MRVCIWSYIQTYGHILVYMIVGYVPPTKWSVIVFIGTIYTNQKDTEQTFRCIYGQLRERVYILNGK